MLIGLTGPAGAGKDTAADYIVSAHKFVAVAFAPTQCPAWDQTLNGLQEAGIDVVVKEIRSNVEAAIIRDHGGFIVRLVRTSDEPGALISAASVRLREVDREIHNDGTPFDLYDKLDAIIGEESFVGAVS